MTDQLSINGGIDKDIEARLRRMTAEEVAWFIKQREHRMQRELEELRTYEGIYKELKVKEDISKDPWRVLDYGNDRRDYGVTTHLAGWQRYWLEYEFRPMMESLVPHNYKWSESAAIRFSLYWSMKHQNKLSYVSEEALKQYYKETYPERGQ